MVLFQLSVRLHLAAFGFSCAIVYVSVHSSGLIIRRKEQDMKIVPRSLGSLGAFAFGALASCPIHASTWTVSFDPAAPAHTNGWDLGKTTEQKMQSSTQPGGRKFDPAKGATAFIESPLYEADVRAVALTAWGNGINKGNVSVVDVWGRASAGEPYASLFSRTGLANTVSVNAPLDQFSIQGGRVVRQLKIGYTKDIGSWVLAKVAVTDDALRAEPPTNLRAAVVDVEARRVRVSWDLAEGLSESEWRTFTTATVGGLGDSETLWRESFDSVPAAAKTEKLDATTLASFGFGSWDAETLLVGWD